MKVVALAGGVGGAKLAHGLQQVLPDDALTVIVNIGDDFEHFGLKICPDLDTVCYTLAGKANPKTGWGLETESWQTLSALAELGAPDWFSLGDRDLATHLERTRRLQLGESLSSITRAFCSSWGVPAVILPVTDHSVPTWVNTEQGELPFQVYFVEKRCEPAVTGFRFGDVNTAKPTPGACEALAKADLVVICPSNPWVSIDPILAIPGIRESLSAKTVVAVSPIIGGQAVKGPAAKMYTELGMVASTSAVAGHYKDLLAGFVLDQADKAAAAELRPDGLACLVTNTLMQSVSDRARLAEEVLAFGKSLPLAV
jgi:LPPG:FO 2-phospho-L-lactate transferase